MKKIKSSLFARGPKLISSVIKLGQLSDIDTVVNNLSELKGMPQKIGQIISMDFSEYLPEEYREKFSKLQAQSLEIDVDKILEILLNELGPEKFGQILNFNARPLGTGSIGQVHSAKILNKEVVFKVRYPEIEKTVHTDLSLMIPIAKAYELFRPKSKDMTILINEARNMLLQEMDYQSEARHLSFFKEALAEDARFCVPALIQEFSTDKIICMDYIEGISLNHFVKEKNIDERKVQVAIALLELFINEFFNLGVVQTDPNFSNCLVTPTQVVLLDFGATKTFTKEFRNIYRELLIAAYDKNEHDILFYGEKLGLVDRKDNPEAVKLFLKFMIDALSFFRKENNPVDFSNEVITKRLMENGWELWKKQRISAPNSNLVFLHRKLGGLFSLLKEMKIQIDLHELWLKIEKVPV